MGYPNSHYTNHFPYDNMMATVMYHYNKFQNKTKENTLKRDLNITNNGNQGFISYTNHGHKTYEVKT